MPHLSDPRRARGGGPRRLGPWVALIGGGSLVVVVGLAITLSLLLSGIVLRPSATATPVQRPPAQPVTPPPGDPASTRPPGGPTAAPTGGSEPTQGPSAPSTPRASTESAAPPAPGGPPFPTEASPTARSTGAGLEDNRLYDVTAAPASLGCADPPLDAPGVPDDELEGLAGEIVDCLVQTMEPLLAEQGLTLTTPSVRTYDDDVDTPCGPVTVERYPAYYCSYDTTIYLNELTDDTAINYAEVTRGYWLILAHEFGHHLQQVAGIFPRYARLWTEAPAGERHELTRRLELQATCFAGVQLNLMAGSLELTDDTGAELRRYAARNNDEVTTTLDHGDADSMQTWLMAGFLRGWGSLGHCRTWSAPAADVS